MHNYVDVPTLGRVEIPHTSDQIQGIGPCTVEHAAGVRVLPGYVNEYSQIEPRLTASPVDERSTRVNAIEGAKWMALIMHKEA